MKHSAENFEKTLKKYAHAYLMPLEIGNRLIARLDFLQLIPKKILVLGCNLGFLTAKLAERYPTAQIITLENDTERFEITKMHLERFNIKNVECLLTNDNTLPFPSEEFDLIVANLTLHYSSDLLLTLSQFRHILAKNGAFLFSHYGPDTFWELQKVGRNIKQNYTPITFLDLHDTGDKLLEARFSDPVSEMEKLEQRYRGLNTFLSDLTVRKEPFFLNFAYENFSEEEKEKMREIYESYRKEDWLPVTYEVIYGLAWKGEPLKHTPDQQGDVRISLEEFLASRK